PDRAVHPAGGVPAGGPRAAQAPGRGGGPPAPGRARRPAHRAHQGPGGVPRRRRGRAVQAGPLPLLRSDMAAKILVVDDDQALAEMLGIVLRKEGLDVAHCADGGRAVAMFREYRPDLVLLDVMLPTLSGVEVCRHLRAESGVPIVLLTARTDTKDVVAGLAAGADDLVIKRYKPHDLRARIRTRRRR